MQGCQCADWNRVLVDEGFVPSALRNVSFSGDVTLGRLEGTFVLPGGMCRASGVTNATLHNVKVGDGCCICNVHEYIANYEIGDGTLIENIGVMAVRGESTFGNGVQVAVLSETGGREVKIFDGLSSHLAYMYALYRHRPAFVEHIDALIDDYVQSRRSSMGKVGKDARISGVASIMDVTVGDAAVIEGASRLQNGSVNSNAEDPVHIGCGVVCEDFIICSGSHVLDGTMLSRCFVGQACHFGHAYSASDCLFFCNCQGENGEACAIFAGPFTVTHHKSTLLIAGMYSFMNAGSGSNQSNHMYKLGPIHQGILERGSKTTSDSYILWPSKIGAFSLVMGRHVTHCDTSNLPFSYLIEKKNETYLSPAVNLRSVGTIRDARKWPKRDARKDPVQFDHINYNILSPYTIQKMIKGLDLLSSLKDASGELSDVYSFHNTKISNSSLKRGLSLYRIAIDKFLGNSLISRLEKAYPDSSEKITQEMLVSALKPDTPVGSGEWADISGLFAPKTEIASLMREVEDGKITSLDMINAELATLAANYYSYEWTWAFQHLQRFYDVNPSKMTTAQAVDIIKQWKEAVLSLDKMVYDDARKEFNLASRTGFGADGDRAQKDADFENVRGVFESNGFVQDVLAHMDKKSALGDLMISRLSN